MSKINPEDKFNFFVPAKFEKSGEAGDMKISGVCSSNVEDSDGEVLDPSGFDFQPLVEKGYYNWNHLSQKEPGAILGRPTRAAIINGGKDLYTEGFLYKGLKQARDVYDLAKTLEEEDPERRLGFSIEGQVIERDPINPKRVTRARITGVAITHCPKNPNTLLSIMKGEYAEPFVEENDECKTCPKCDHNQLMKGKCLECGYTEKSMTTEVVPQRESVDGQVKSEEDLNKVLTKSEIYKQIFYLYTKEAEKANQIYSIIKSVSNMTTNQEANISQETLNKAFNILGLAKSETEKTAEDYDKKDELMKNDEEVEKASARDMAKSLFEKGMGKDEVYKSMIEKGYNATETQSSVEALCAEYTANKDGGSVTPQHLDGITKSITTLSTALDSKFEAIGQILKSQVEENQILKGQIETLSSELSTSKQQLKTIGDQTQGRKSVNNVRVIEKFEKSENGGKNSVNTFSISNPEDRTNLGNILFEKATELRESNRPSQLLEDTIMNLEISKSMSTQSQQLLKSMNIEVIQ